MDSAVNTQGLPRPNYMTQAGHGSIERKQRVGVRRTPDWLAATGSCLIQPLPGLREHARGHDPGPRADLSQRGQDAVHLGKGQDSAVHALRLHWEPLSCCRSLRLPEHNVTLKKDRNPPQTPPSASQGSTSHRRRSPRTRSRSRSS